MQEGAKQQSLIIMAEDRTTHMCYILDTAHATVYNHSALTGKEDGSTSYHMVAVGCGGGVLITVSDLIRLCLITQRFFWTRVGVGGRKNIPSPGRL